MQGCRDRISRSVQVQGPYQITVTRQMLTIKHRPIKKFKPMVATFDKAIMETRNDQRWH